MRVRAWGGTHRVLGINGVVSEVVRGVVVGTSAASNGLHMIVKILSIFNDTVTVSVVNNPSVCFTLLYTPVELIWAVNPVGRMICLEWLNG
jgi:hypothetical protein